MANNNQSFIRKLLPTAHKIILDRHIKKILGDLEGKVLILGAGQQKYSKLIPLASHLIISDISNYKNVDIIIDAHSLPYPEKNFDAIVAIEVYEHLHSPSEAAKEMFRVLKKNGKAIISTPFIFRLHGDPFDYQRYTNAGLKVLFKAFSNIKIIPFGSRIHVISDILTTQSKFFVIFRIVNHLISSSIFSSNPSIDCPSGYITILEK